MILAVDTASKTASAAIVEENNIIAEFSVLSEKTHSKAILPMIEAMFNCTGKKIDDVDYIACSAGPGSFTGLRIGAAVAKSAAFALNKKILPVASLDALAYNISTDFIVCPMIDARRNHVYTAFYKYEGAILKRLTDYMTIPMKDAVSAADGFRAPVYFIGICSDELKAAKNAVVAPSRVNMHRAGILGRYAYAHLEFITPVSGDEFKLIYMSRSQAEANNGI